jgi:hypothetical protein
MFNKKASDELKHTDAAVDKSMIIQAVQDLLDSGVSLTFPITLYVVNKKNSRDYQVEPELYFDSSNTKFLKTKEVKEALENKCLEIYKNYDKEDFNKLKRGLRSTYSSSWREQTQEQIEPIEDNSRWNAPPELKLAMTKQDWIRIGKNAGWIKSAQQQQPMIPTGRMNSPQAKGVAMQTMDTNTEQTKRIQEALKGGSKKMADQLADLQRQLDAKQQAYNVACRQGDESKSSDCVEIEDTINQIREQITNIDQKINENKSDLDQLSKNNLLGGFSLA